MASTNFNSAGATANLPSWGDSTKWNSPAGDAGFGGGVSPGSSFEPSPGFPSTGDSSFWKNQPTDENYYNKGKNFLDAFKNIKFGQDENKYQNQSQQGGFQTGGKGDTSGGSVGKIAPDVSIYTPPTPYAPFTVAGMPGEKGKGGLIGQIAGTALGFALGGPAGASLGGSLGGTAGSFFG
jgi:hypothetical protein